MNKIPASVPVASDPGFSDAIDELPVAYVEMDAHGAITRANRITRATHSSHAGELIGKLAWELMPTEEQALSAAAFASAMETSIEPGVSRRSIYTSANTFRVYDLHRNLIRDADGKPVGMRVASVDVTEAVTAQQEAEKARQWLESVFASMPEAVIVTDALGIVRNVNPAAEDLLGWKAGELIGQDFEEAFSPRSLAGQVEVGLVTVLSESVHGVARILDHDRRPRRVEISSSPMLEKAHGFTSGVVNVLRRVEESG
jgi:PAS domain S-box-containing protein